MRERASIITARPSESFCSRVVFELTPRQQRESDENPGCKRARNYKAGRVMVIKMLSVGCPDETYIHLQLHLALFLFLFRISSLCLRVFPLPRSFFLPFFHRSKCAHASKRWGKSVRGSQIPRKPPKEPISVVPFCWGTKRERREGIGKTLERKRRGRGETERESEREAIEKGHRRKEEK